MTYPIPRKTRIGAVLMLVAVSIATWGASVFYTNDTRDQMERDRIKSERQLDQARIEADQEWCVIIRVFVEAYRTNPPQTETAKVLQAEFERLYSSRYCAAVGLPNQSEAPSSAPASPPQSTLSPQGR